LHSRNKPWTAEDDERLKALAVQGASIIRAAGALNRKINSVRDRARKLGCPFATLAAERKRWVEMPTGERRQG
jgi:hypothetical protein